MLVSYKLKRKGTQMEEQKEDVEVPTKFKPVQIKRLWGLKSYSDDEHIVYEILKILGDEELTIDRASRVLADAQTMLPKLAKLPKK